MKEFTDGKGNKRQLELTIAVVEAIRSAARFRDGSPVDLYKIADEDFKPSVSLSDGLSGSSTLQKIIQQPEVLCQVLHAAIGCEFEELAACLTSKGIANATEALVREVIDFFFPWTAEEMHAAFDQMQALNKQASQERTRLIRSPEFKKHLQAVTTQPAAKKKKSTRGKKSGGSQDA